MGKRQKSSRPNSARTGMSTLTTINPNHLHASALFSEASRGAVEIGCDRVKYCLVKAGIEEYVHASILLEDKWPVLILISEETILSSVYTILRMILSRDRWPSILQWNSKTAAPQTRKVLNALKADPKSILVTEPSCLPKVSSQACCFKTVLVVNRDPRSHDSAAYLQILRGADKVIQFVKQRMSVPIGASELKLQPSILAKSVSMVASAKKLHLLQKPPLGSKR
jgi:hypothetical protein